MHSSVEANSTVCVAIVNHNGKRYLAETLDQVDEHCTGVAEVIMVDNLSTDGSVEFVEQNYPHVRIIARAVNDGPGPARNLAIQTASADLVLLLDNDAAPCAGCLSVLTEALHAFPGAVVAMPAVLYFDHPSLVQFAGAHAHFMGVVTPLDRNVPVEQLDKCAEYCTSLISAALLVDKRRLGGHRLFNDSLFIYQEDHEAGYRCGVSGLKLLRVPSAACLHREGTTGLSIRETGKVLPTRVRHTLFNRWYILATLYQWHTLLRFLPALLCYEVVVVSGAIVGGWWADWLWAAREFTRRAPAIVRQRRRVQNHRIVSDADILKGGLFPFNTDTEHSRLQRVGQKVVDVVGQVNWWLAKPQKMQR